MAYIELQFKKIQDRLPFWIAKRCIACILLFLEGIGLTGGMIKSRATRLACRSRTFAALEQAARSSNVTDTSQASDTL